MNIINTNKRTWAQLNPNIFIIILIGLACMLNSFFRYKNWDPTLGGQLLKLIYTFLIVFLFLKIKGVSKNCNFSRSVFLMILLPLFSMINSNLYFNQGFFSSIWALTCNSIWIVYFVLHKLKVSEKTLLKFFFFSAIAVVGIQIIQQFLYPNVLFGINTDITSLSQEVAEKRNGLWRFRMHQNGYLTMPIMLALLGIYKLNTNKKLLFFIIIFLVSIYLSLTRQVIVACLLVIFLSFSLGNSKINYKYLFLGLLILFGLYFFYDVLFSSFAEQTSQEASEDNIRLLAATYFWNQSNDSILSLLFGYGEPASPAFKDLTEAQTTVMHFFTSDVGFVGKIYEYGLIYVLSCYILLYKLFFKYKNQIPNYIRLMVIFASIMSPMIFPFYSTRYYLVWTILLYISDLHINKSPLASRSTQNFNNKF